MFGIQFLNGLGTSQQFGDAVWALRHNFFIIHGNTVYRGKIGRRFDGIKIWIPSKPSLYVTSPHLKGHFFELPSYQSHSKDRLKIC